MNRKALIGLIAGATACMTLAGASMPAGAQNADPGITAPNSTSATAEQVGTAFTFQGQLKKDGGAFSGACSFRFTLFDAATGTGQVGTPQTVNATVTNGLFTAPLDFGNQFTGQARWLETAVKCAGDADFIPQSPRLNMTSSPYAIGLMPGAIIRGPGNGSPEDNAVLLVQSTFTRTTGLQVEANVGDSIGVLARGAFRGVSGSATHFGVSGYGGQIGVDGQTTDGIGVRGISNNAIGVQGISYDDTSSGVYGENDSGGPGVRGHSVGNAGVYGTSVNAFGVYGEANNNYAIKGKSANSVGVFGESTNSAGVYGFSAQYDGVIGRTTNPARYAVYADGKVAISGGTDIAERFSSASDQLIEPGTVVVVDEANPGQINPSGSAYATTVVGIVSGAGGVEPGLVLHQKGMMEGPHVVAIAGRVYVKATAANDAIKPGDLLTSSDLAGHAMKATDHDLAFGAVIGKALTGLDSDTGLVLVLVNLQ
jgi:hypothetical protein